VGLAVAETESQVRLGSSHLGFPAQYNPPHLQPNRLAWRVATFYIDRDNQKGKNQDTNPEDIQDLANLAELGRFCRRLGREAKQGEVGLVVGDEYFAIRQFEEV
jgi:hypothetical protein